MCTEGPPRLPGTALLIVDWEDLNLVSGTIPGALELACRRCLEDLESGPLPCFALTWLSYQPSEPPAEAGG